jgi:hypothetical protein
VGWRFLGLYNGKRSWYANHYNYVTVSVYDGLGSLDNDAAKLNEVVSSVYSNEEIEGFWNKTSAARLHNGQDVFFCL